MIRLIASDVDGTLVPEGRSAGINPRLFEVIRRLKEQGIWFAVASGRQYPSILHEFAPLRQEIFFIADNGSFVIEKDAYLFSSTFPDETWKAIVRHVHTFPGTHIMVSSEGGSYTDSMDPAFVSLMADNYGLDLIYTEDLEAISLRVSKIGVYCADQNPREAALEGRKYFEQDANIVVSGDYWCDYIPKASDKGKALERLMRRLGISREETIAFGDNINDLGLIRTAGISYVVPGAQPELKAAATYVMTEGPEEDGVLHILEELSAGLSEIKDRV